MAEMKVEVDVTVWCDECGGILIISIRDTDIRVEPCPKCVGSAQQEGYDDGHNDGFDEGLSDGDK